MTRRKRVGYAKLGRSMQLKLENCSSLGGDNEMVPTVKLLAERHPDVDFVLIGRNSGETPASVGLPDNVHNPWMEWMGAVRRDLNKAELNHPNYSIPEHQRVLKIIDHYTGPAIQECDEIILWLGQHGTANTPIPTVKDRSKLTKPYDWATLYASYLIKGINNWRDQDPHTREEILLNSDARNYVKFRDAKWPWLNPVISQYDFVNNAKHERYEEDRVLLSKVQNIYSRLEISSLLPGTPFGDTLTFSPYWSDRKSFGMVLNETRRDVNPGKARRTALKHWIFDVDIEPEFIHGSWSKKTLDEEHWDIRPLPQLDYISKIQTVRSTFTTPASGSGWATAKPWECFAAGVVCFFHPAYDDQNHILGDAPAELRDYLRVKNPRELARRVATINQDEETWNWVTLNQLKHYQKAIREMTYLHQIEERLDLASAR